MKRLVTVAVVSMILYCTYYDLSIGTLPNGLTKAAETEQEEQSHPGGEQPVPPPLAQAPYQEVIVEPGHTVLSIVEHLHEGPIPASIQEIVYDFKELNQGLEPEDMQIGKVYRFPLYHSH
ncbi:hypothetical protein M3212_11790 [Alkalihalobacillus oceani]|uniref:hypothetical protein n=1 Tax=Halalkalibacter oceani TaxID=1653776 RepID=UPI00203AF23D|nr:hypothetical protein [Halalkalibacter oceani]MCM3761465.1 hypothetical protein [Halalkalibacter oceani]